jgi:hypothetical protein
MKKEEKITLAIVIVCILILVWLVWMYPTNAALREQGWINAWNNNSLK